MYYVGALTSLFESIAMIVSQHQPVVEKYYGPRKMHNVVARLVGECDRVVSGLLESWEEDRNAKRKVCSHQSCHGIWRRHVIYHSCRILRQQTSQQLVHLHSERPRISLKKTLLTLVRSTNSCPSSLGWSAAGASSGVSCMTG